jgi:hypothetical protein
MQADMQRHGCTRTAAQFLFGLVDFDLDQSKHIDERNSANTAE